MNTVIDPIEAIDRAYTQGIDAWEALVALGASDEEDMGILRWRQGDLAMRVEKHYGDKTLSKYASAINVKYPTLKQRWQMSRFYEKDTRVSFPTLSYSHYREAMRLGEFWLAFDAMVKAQRRDWPVWKLEMFIDRCLGKSRKVQGSIEGTITRSYSQDDGQYFVVRANIDLKVGQIITIKAR